MSSSSSSDLSLNSAGMGGLVLFFRAIPKFVPAGKQMDMGLPVPELHPDPLSKLPNLADPTFFTGDPGTKFRRAFSQSMTGNRVAFLLGMSSTDTSNGGMVTGPSLKCSSVLGPATSKPGLGSSPCGCELGPSLDWELDARGSKN